MQLDFDLVDSYLGFDPPLLFNRIIYALSHNPYQIQILAIKRHSLEDFQVSDFGCKTRYRMLCYIVKSLIEFYIIYTVGQINYYRCHSLAESCMTNIFDPRYILTSSYI